MTTVFLSSGVWDEITWSARNSKVRCFVAVAYFGKGASRQLPLPAGSSLVVDAGDASVTAGRTCPAELANLVKRGVRVFNEPSLHAKVFVIGKTAYIGSTNVSQHSANQLTEAAICTTDPGAVNAARSFVENHSYNDLGPGALKELQKIYRPPLVPGGGKGKRQLKKEKGPTLPRVFLAQLIREDRSEFEERLHEKGLPVAKQHRKHPRIWVAEDFHYKGACSFSRQDIVIQVTDEGDGKVLVDVPGNVLHVEGPEKDGRGLKSVVFLERPNRKRRSVASLARQLGCTQKQLRGNGIIKNRAFAYALLKTLGNES